MVERKHVVLCGGVDQVRKRTQAGSLLRLKLGKREGKGQIHLDVGAITRKMVAKLPYVLHDLLEVATYVYVADQATSRGGTRSFDYGYDWHRHFIFRIPVRRHGVWSDPETREVLEEALSVASGDTYSFEFVPQDPGSFPEFLEFKTETEPARRGYNEVVLFSGGIDSATGAIEEYMKRERLPLLVSHQSNSKHVSLQRALHDYIHAISPKRQEPLHVPVKINKDKRLTKDTTQRSRSFVYAVLGAIVAHMFGLRQAKFYENGIVSSNLMWDGQTLQARATRSTHPHVLRLFSNLVSLLLDGDFVFDNPYFNKTKTEVCLRLKELHQETCIEKTRSCAASVYEEDKTHCGTCSQCIDRRFATLASACEKYDPDKLYKLNVFTNDLSDPRERVMALGFVGFAQKCGCVSREEFVQACSSKVHEIARHMGAETAEIGLHSLYLLHRRHAESVMKVMTKQTIDHALPLVFRTLPRTCLLRMYMTEQDVATIPKAGQPKTKKHGKGKLNEEVERLLALHPSRNAVRIAQEVGNTTPGAVRKTKAWKSRPTR